jgi:hypothetical protein
MRSPLSWGLAALGVIVVILIGAAIGGRDDSDETVPAGEWAQNVCGSVAVWRGELEAIVEDIRTPNAFSTTGEEPQSETPQGRTGFVRRSVERSVQATETLVEGVDNAGTPDTEQGEEAANQISSWADSSLEALEEAEDSLDDEADTLEQSIEQLGEAMRAIGSSLTGGVQAITGVARLDPELGAALRDSSTCDELREETTR